MASGLVRAADWPEDLDQRAAVEFHHECNPRVERDEASPLKPVFLPPEELRQIMLRVARSHRIGLRQLGTSGPGRQGPSLTEARREIAFTLRLRYRWPYTAIARAIGMRKADNVARYFQQ